MKPYQDPEQSNADIVFAEICTGYVNDRPVAVITIQANTDVGLAALKTWCPEPFLPLPGEGKGSINIINYDLSAFVDRVDQHIGPSGNKLVIGFPPNLNEIVECCLAADQTKH